MPNGTGLLGDPSSTQSGVIIPQPGNDSIYYVFTPRAQHETVGGLYYSVVNMRLNGGLGAVIQKNISLVPQAYEKVTAIRHANGKDIWVITRQFDSYNYYAYLITSTGISISPVISNSPNFVPIRNATSIGYLKPSTNGKLLVAGFWNADLYYNIDFIEISQFNSSTGIISNFKKIKDLPPSLNRIARVVSAYGIEFSPNSNKLYVSIFADFINVCNNCPSIVTFIHQYDVSNFDSTAIANSIVLIDSSGSTLNNNSALGYSAMQLAKNGKIYIAEYGEKKLGVINNPNATGVACNLDPDGVNITYGNSKYGLPTFNQTYFSPNFQTYDYDYVEDCNKSVRFTLNTAYTYDSVRWYFDDAASGVNNNSIQTNPVHVFSGSGNYNVQLLVFRKYGCLDVIDTVNKQIEIGATWFNFGADKNFCEGDSVLLNATVTGNAVYVWSTGATTQILTVKESGIYWCDVTRGGCTYRDEIVLTKMPVPVVNLGNNKTLCEGNTQLLDATNTNATYLWQDNTTSPTYVVTKAGTYSVSVKRFGCEVKDTVTISYNPKPRFTLGPDQLICPGMTITLNPQLSNVFYLWQDGTIAPTYTVTQPGLYYLIATNNCGSKSDSVLITKGICKLYIPNAFTPNGDGKNDVFKAGFGENITEFSLRIFNRYGELVFESKDKNKAWDGTYKGSRQPNGSFIWMIRYKTATDNNLQQLKGTVLLIR